MRTWKIKGKVDFSLRDTGCSGSRSQGSRNWNKKVDLGFSTVSKGSDFEMMGKILGKKHLLSKR